MTYYVAQSATGHGTFNILVVNASAASSKVSHTLRVVDRARAAARDHRQVGSVPAAHVVARRDGRPDPGVGAHPRGHDGGRRCVPRRPALPDLLVRPLDRHAGPRRSQRDGGDRWHHRAHRRRARVRPGRHQEGARVLHDQPARLHGDGARCRRVDGGGVPPLHARVLQGRPLPRFRIGEPLGIAPLLRHEEGHGRPARSTCRRRSGRS